MQSFLAGEFCFAKKQQRACLKLSDFSFQVLVQLTILGES
jgi:hypothetical protein